MKIKKYSYAISLIALPMAAITSCSPGGGHQASSEDDDYQVAVYYFPNYHVDKRNEGKFGKNWTEWELVKDAKPKFDGHEQPKVPLWGYTDEADPADMAQKIDAASSHGVDVFIFDWYYYDDGLFLERALEEGFLKAENNDRLKFSLMWANHNYPNVFPYTAGEERLTYYPGKISPETWDRLTDYVIEKYFSHPSYWLIDGAPYFSIYDLKEFIDSFGSVASAKQGLEDFREKVRAAGFIDLHFNAIVRKGTAASLPGVVDMDNASDFIHALGFNSTTSYVWVHHGGLTTFPATPYEVAKETYFDAARTRAADSIIPYFPHVSMGWDSSPRTNQEKEFTNYGYPYGPVLVGNTPDAFKQALAEAKGLMDETGSKILTINSWNEWTEGSYLEPDTVHGLGYLEAIREVFPPGQ